MTGSEVSTFEDRYRAGDRRVLGSLVVPSVAPDLARDHLTDAFSAAERIVPRIAEVHP